jgi:hypothetical protein
MKRFGLSLLLIGLMCEGAVSANAQASQQAQPPAQAQQAAPPQFVPQQVQPPPPPEEEATIAAITTPPVAEDSSIDKSKIVYVSDFELDAVDAQGKFEKDVPAVSVANPVPAEVPKGEEAAEQAGRLIDFMSVTLVKELEKAGYSAHRLKPEDTRPSDGICISGIFAEPDEQNRLRRAVMGTFTPDGKMSLFVGIANLARPDQAIYAAAEPSGANRAGAVITVSSYAPVARFEIGKSTTEKAVKDTAAGIVADLNTLLGANVMASR